MTGDQDDRLFRGVEQARRVLGRAEVALDQALRALIADDHTAAVSAMRSAGLFMRSGADTIAFVLEPDEVDLDGEP